jgi:AcrR family transcriptional regulator
MKETKADRTRGAILAAARELFAAQGYAGTTVRDVAATAGIDAALVIRYFGSKDELFMRASDFDLQLPDLASVKPSKIGDALIRRFLDNWEGEHRNEGLVVLLRSASANDFAADNMREVFAAQLAPALARAGKSNAVRRAGLIGSQLLGLAFCRYVLMVPPIVAMTPNEIIASVGPTLQRYVDFA